MDIYLIISGVFIGNVLAVSFLYGMAGAFRGKFTANHAAAIVIPCAIGGYGAFIFG